MFSWDEICEESIFSSWKFSDWLAGYQYFAGRVYRISNETDMGTDQYFANHHTYPVFGNNVAKQSCHGNLRIGWRLQSKDYTLINNQLVY